ncbi:MlaD family protein [Camelimonas abortus]|uniref:MlaD family protein n=1 Tax=Camelimonas abortus TaxID=1017184 RepID=A0ABV7LHB3_9HYPH
METRANYALVGLFTLVVIAAGFMFVYWFGGGQGANTRATYKVVFTGSVSGLGPGSLVTFNGIRVGEVKGVSFDPDDPRRVIATIDISRDVSLRADTRALLDVQIVSGVGSVALVGGSVDSPVLKPCPAPDCTILAERSDFQDIVESARNVARRANEVADKLAVIIDQNQGAIDETISNINRFSKALGDNAGSVNTLLANVGPAAEQVRALAATLDRIARDVDPKQVRSIIANIDRFSAALGDSSGRVQETVNNVASITAKINRAADQVEGVLRAVQSFLGSADGQGAVDSIQKAADSIRRLADNLDRRTAEITAGINRFTSSGLGDVRALTLDGQRTLNELNRTLRSINQNPQQFIFGPKPALPQFNGRQ